MTLLDQHIMHAVNKQKAFRFLLDDSKYCCFHSNKCILVIHLFNRQCELFSQHGISDDHISCNNTESIKYPIANNVNFWRIQNVLLPQTHAFINLQLLPELDCWT